LAWFISGGIWWLATGEGVAFVFGGGWLLMGLLLHARVRLFWKMANTSIENGGSMENAP
jgi:hypothetical protein